MKLTALARQVASYSGVHTDELARALGTTPDAVRCARDRLGQDLELGGPRQAPRRRGVDLLTNEDFDGLMRGNRSVCG